jgi:hypothetical protein
MSDAFGTGCFTSEADLMRSRMVQRNRKVMPTGAIDLRRDASHGSSQQDVKLLGGPYNGKAAVVNAGQREAWVIGDYSYLLRSCGLWIWFYDSYA